MIEAGSASTKAKPAFIGFAPTNVDVERICRESSEKSQPSEAFILTSDSVGGAMLAVNMRFLERGQLLACPGLPLLGAAFGPEWGFARAEINLNRNGSAEFCSPHGHSDTFTEGDMFGYRLCPMESHEIPGVIRQLAHIRAELAKPRQQSPRRTEIKFTVTDL
ncbi:MAG: hypothetical protein ACYDBH_15460 [Acidobacteriaceae bacterium]